MKYPIGIQSFDQIREMGFVYVDKTAMVYRLATEGKIYFLSRPRRFGKSLLVSTLKHYFLGHKELFQGLSIEALEQEWLEYPVFHIDFNGANFLQADELERKIESYVATWEQQYGKDPLATTLGDRFKGVLAAAHQQTRRRAVVLIDEYDKPILLVGWFRQGGSAADRREGLCSSLCYRSPQALSHRHQLLLRDGND